MRALKLKPVMHGVLMALLFGSSLWSTLGHAQPKAKATLTPSGPAVTPKVTRTYTAVAPTNTLQPTNTLVPTPTPAASETPVADTPSPTDTVVASPTIESPTPTAIYTPWPAALLCAAHDSHTFHTLWNAELGCHYDHEHGQSPFTPDVASAFPGFNLQALMGGVQIGHTNPSSPMENTHKHGGFKWQVNLDVPCEAFEGNEYCVTASVMQYHAFGDARMEMEARIHSALGLFKVCRMDEAADCGFMYVVQHVDYGQRVSQYQGDVIPYTDAQGCTPAVGCQPNPVPGYPSPIGPYVSIDRYGTCTGCRPSLDFVRSRNANANSTWTSKTGPGVAHFGSDLLTLLFRVRDTYQLKDDADNTYPFTFGFVCRGSGIQDFNPAGCRYNNTTTAVHEVAGEIPAEWDNLAGFDTNLAQGRITAEGYVTRFGDLNLDCTAPGPDCHPIKLVDMFAGKYGAALPGAKVSNPSPVSNPERDIYFCGQVVCAETSPSAAPSGWVGPEN